MSQTKPKADPPNPGVITFVRGNVVDMHTLNAQRTN